MSATAVTSDWISDAIGAAVAAVDAEPLEVAGAAGELSRLKLTYAEGSSGPASVIVKARGSTETQQAMDAALGLFARERYIYAEVGPALPMRLPRCYFPGSTDGDLPMLIEDLGHLRAGDQVVGLAHGDVERLVDVLAEMHARFWESPLPGSEPERLMSWTDPMVGAMLTQLVTSGVTALRERYARRVDSAVLDAIEAEAPNWAGVLARCAEGPQTFVHNDFRGDNIFFDTDGEPVVIDWQLAGRCRGTQDLAYLLSGSVTADELRDSWRPLVQRYHAALTATGINDYSLEDCMFHYRQSLLYTLAPGIAMLGQMQMAGGDPRGLADTLVLRTLTHAADLDAFATL